MKTTTELVGHLRTAHSRRALSAECMLLWHVASTSPNTLESVQKHMVHRASLGITGRIFHIVQIWHLVYVVYRSPIKCTLFTLATRHIVRIVHRAQQAITWPITHRVSKI